MPIPGDVGMTFRVRAPAVPERGRAFATSMEARLGGSLVAPASGTYTLLSPTGAVVSTGAVTVTGSVATYTVPSGDLPSTLAFGGGYVEEWDLVFSGSTRTARRPTYLSRRALWCPITQADIEALYPFLSSTQSEDAPSLQSYIDEAWADSLQRLLQTGTWPESIVDVDALRIPVRELSLHYIFRALTLGSNQTRWAELSREHSQAAEAAWAKVTVRRDVDQDGAADSTTRVGAIGQLRRNGAPPYIYSQGMPGRTGV